MRLLSILPAVLFCCSSLVPSAVTATPTNSTERHNGFQRSLPRGAPVFDLVLPRSSTLRKRSTATKFANITMGIEGDRLLHFGIPATQISMESTIEYVDPGTKKPLVVKLDTLKSTLQHLDPDKQMQFALLSCYRLDNETKKLAAKVKLEKQHRQRQRMVKRSQNLGIVATPAASSLLPSRTSDLTTVGVGFALGALGLGFASLGSWFLSLVAFVMEGGPLRGNDWRLSDHIISSFFAVSGTFAALGFIIGVINTFNALIISWAQRHVGTNPLGTLATFLLNNALVKLVTSFLSFDMVQYESPGDIEMTRFHQALEDQGQGPPVEDSLMESLDDEKDLHVVRVSRYGEAGEETVSLLQVDQHSTANQPSGSGSN